MGAPGNFGHQLQKQVADERSSGGGVWTPVSRDGDPGARAVCSTAKGVEQQELSSDLSGTSWGKGGDVPSVLTAEWKSW